MSTRTSEPDLTEDVWDPEEDADETGDPDTREVPGEPPEDGEPPEVAPARSWPLVVLVAAAVLLLALGGWFLLQAGELRDGGPVDNVALVDSARTAEVNAAVTSALNQVFSYSYDRTEDTEKAAADLLRGKARDTYDQLFATVRELAPEQKIVLTTRVVSSAVQELTDDTARLLVFLDQAATRADKDTSNAAAAQLSVTASLEDGRWVITDMVPR